MKHWIFIALAFLSVLSQATLAAPVEAQITWTAPTERADGSELQASEIAGYRLYSAVDEDVNADLDAPHILITEGTVENMEIDLLPQNQPYTLNFALRTVDVNGLVSGLSEVASMTVVVESTAPPGPPTGVTLELNCITGCVISNAP